MKKKKLNTKLSLSKKTISNFNSNRLTGGTNNPDNSLINICDGGDTDPSVGCQTNGGAPSCDGCLPTTPCQATQFCSIIIKFSRNCMFIG